jgi:hypothetical protein
MILVIVLPLFAGESPVNFGFYGGLNFASMHGTDIDAMGLEYGNSAAGTTSGNGGIRIGYSLKNWLHVESGAFLSGNGFEFLLGSASGTVWSGGAPRNVTESIYSVRKVTFLEFPLLLKLETRPGDEDVFQLFGFGGLSGGIVTSAVDKIVRETTTSNIMDQNGSTDRNDLAETDLFKDRTITDSLGHQLHYTYNDYYRHGNISIVLGAGLEKRYQNFGFFLLCRYMSGLLNFNSLTDKARKALASFSYNSSSSNVVFLGEPTAFFKSFQLSAGVNIYLQRTYVVNYEPHPRE